MTHPSGPGGPGPGGDGGTGPGRLSARAFFRLLAAVQIVLAVVLLIAVIAGGA